MDTIATSDLLAHVERGVATATLNRPSALNALSWDMIVGLRKLLDAWEQDDNVRVVVLRGAGEKAFCAGGDIRAFYRQFQGHGRVDHEFFEVEYALDYRIHTYAKPIVAWIDGVVMGGGMGLSQGAALRVVGERTRMAMPETAIGLFPDVGGSYFLSRTPGALGFYIGLVGPTLDAADALYAGLADIYLTPASLERLDEWIATAPMETIASRDDRARLDRSELETFRDGIERHFNAPSVEAIVESLPHEPVHREWAQRTREALLRNSPLSLKLTHEQLRRGRDMTLADCFRMELGLVRAALDHSDFFEGIRALLIDKDRKPRWDPARLEDVTARHVDQFFHQPLNIRGIP